MITGFFREVPDGSDHGVYGVHICCYRIMSSPRSLVVALAFALAGSVIPAAGQSRGELVERTLAIVGGSAITMSDVQTALALGLVNGANDVASGTEKVIERALILREVERYAPPEPDPLRVDERLSQLRARVSGKLDEVLAAGGFSEARLRAWLRDDLRIAAYLDQRFAADGPERRESLIQDWTRDLRRRTTVVELWRK